jgi:hypothetical protein
MISTKNEKSLGSFEIFRPIIREEKNSKKMLKEGKRKEKQKVGRKEVKRC